jgi:hypothetical protein
MYQVPYINGWLITIAHGRAHCPSRIPLLPCLTHAVYPKKSRSGAMTRTSTEDGGPAKAPQHMMIQASLQH